MNHTMYTAHKQQKTGFSLVEVLVAVALLMMALVAPLTIAARGIQAGFYARNKTIAQFLAQEGIEAFVAARNDQVITALHTGGTYSWSWPPQCTSSAGCNIMFSDNTGTATAVNSAVQCNTPNVDCRMYFNQAAPRDKYVLPSGGGTKTPFWRVIKLTPHTNANGDTYYDVTATVDWQSPIFASGNQSVTLHSELYHLY